MHGIFRILPSIHSPLTMYHRLPLLAYYISSYTKSIADADVAAACIRNLYFLMKTNSFHFFVFTFVLSMTKTKRIWRYIFFVYSYCFHYFILNILLKYCVKSKILHIVRTRFFFCYLFCIIFARGVFMNMYS